MSLPDLLEDLSLRLDAIRGHTWCLEGEEFEKFKASLVNVYTMILLPSGTKPFVVTINGQVNEFDTFDQFIDGVVDPLVKVTVK